MTRLGDLLDFGQLFKAFSSNYFTQINLHCYAIFVKLSKSFIFLVKSFLGNFLDIWQFLSGHTEWKPFRRIAHSQIGRRVLEIIVLQVSGSLPV